MNLRALDRAPLDALVEDIGAEDVVSLLDAYFEHTPALRDALRDGARDQNRRAISRAAHTLRSNAAMLGAMELSRACTRLEDDADTEAWPALQERTDHVIRLYEQATVALHQERARLASA